MKNEDFAFKPLSNYIVIDVVPRGKSKILTPETVKVPLDKSDCIVVAVSEEKDKDDKPMVRNVKLDDRVLLAPTVAHTGAAMMLGKKGYVVVRETEILGIMTGEVEDEEATKLIVN